MRDTFFCWLALLIVFAAALGATVARIEHGILSIVDLVVSLLIVALSAYNVRKHYLKAANHTAPS